MFCAYLWEYEAHWKPAVINTLICCHGWLLRKHNNATETLPCPSTSWHLSSGDSSRGSGYITPPLWESIVTCHSSLLFMKCCGSGIWIPLSLKNACDWNGGYQRVWTILCSGKRQPWRSGDCNLLGLGAIWNFPRTGIHLLSAMLWRFVSTQTFCKYKLIPLFYPSSSWPCLGNYPSVRSRTYFWDGSG